MRKDDFLEILRDYLKQGFNPYEIENIICQYESYFLEGYLQDKDDLQIIDSLKSPKAIAEELFRQKKYENIKEEKIKNKIKILFLNLKNNIKNFYTKTIKYIDTKLTPDIKSPNKLNKFYIRLIIYLMSFILFCIYFLMMFVIIFIIIFSIILSVALLLIFIQLMDFYKDVLQILLLLFFNLIFFIGSEILFWQLFISIIRVILKGIKKYCNWLRTKKLYFKVKK